MKILLCLPALFGLLAANIASAATLLVGNKSEASVSMIDLDSGIEVARVATEVGPHEVAVSSDGRLAVVTNYGTGPQPGNTLSVIEVEAGKAVRLIDLGKYTRPHGILFLPDTNKVLVTAEGARALLLVDVSSGEIEKAVASGQDVSHMVAFNPATGMAYVANIGPGTVSVIDVRAGELLGVHPSGQGAEGIALADGGKRLWVTNRADDTAAVFTTGEFAKQEVLAVSGFPIRAEILPAQEGVPEKVLVTSARSGELSIIDPVALKVEKTVDLGLALQGAADGLFADQFGESSIPIGIEVEPGSRRVWIAHAGADAVQELEVGSWRQLRLLKTGREPDAMGYSHRSVVAAQ